MALVKCKDCGKEFSTDVKKCIHCGATKPPGLSEQIASVVGLIAFCSIMYYFFLSDDSTPEGQTNSTAAQVISDTTPIKDCSIDSMQSVSIVTLSWTELSDVCSVLVRAVDYHPNVKELTIFADATAAIQLRESVLNGVQQTPASIAYQLGNIIQGRGAAKKRERLQPIMDNTYKIFEMTSGQITPKDKATIFL